GIKQGILQAGVVHHLGNKDLVDHLPVALTRYGVGRVNALNQMVVVVAFQFLGALAGFGVAIGIGLRNRQEIVFVYVEDLRLAAGGRYSDLLGRLVLGNGDAIIVERNVWLSEPDAQHAGERILAAAKEILEILRNFRTCSPEGGFKSLIAVVDVDHVP